MHELTAFQRDMLHILAGLAGDDPNGLEIKEEIEAYYDREINHGQLYPALDKMARLGFVDKSTQNGRANCYEITAEGKSELDERAAWEQQYYQPRPHAAAIRRGD